MQAPMLYIRPQISAEDNARKLDLVQKHARQPAQAQFACKWHGIADVIDDRCGVPHLGLGDGPRNEASNKHPVHGARGTGHGRTAQRLHVVRNGSS